MKCFFKCHFAQANGFFLDYRQKSGGTGLDDTAKKNKNQNLICVNGFIDAFERDIELECLWVHIDKDVGEPESQSRVLNLGCEFVRRCVEER